MLMYFGRTAYLICAESGKLGAHSGHLAIGQRTCLLFWDTKDQPDRSQEKPLAGFYGDTVSPPRWTNRPKASELRISRERASLDAHPFVAPEGRTRTACTRYTTFLDTFSPR